MPGSTSTMNVKTPAMQCSCPRPVPERHTDLITRKYIPIMHLTVSPTRLSLVIVSHRLGIPRLGCRWLRSPWPNRTVRPCNPHPPPSEMSPAAISNGEKDNGSNYGANGNDKGFVLVYPRLDLLSKVGPFADTLGEISKTDNDKAVMLVLTLLHLPPPPHGVPSRKFCCRP
jgi:hypothetical protein